MPRVSQEHLDARRRQILDAARTCFVRDGFHATSMQDVLREAELSAGAVYRYFKGKDEIILAIARDALSRLADVVASSTEQTEPPPPDEVMGRIFEVLEDLGRQGFSRLAVQIWSEALRNEAIGDEVRRAYAGLREAMYDLVRTYQAQGRIDDAADAEEVGRVLVAIVPGFVLQHGIMGDVDAAQFTRGLRALLST
jgi:AcrR family transcriptional regulator